MITVYIENQDGIYSVYCDKHDPYICSALLKEAKVEKELGEYLCETTKRYNEAQDVMYHLFND